MTATSNAAEDRRFAASVAGSGWIFVGVSQLLVALVFIPLSSDFAPLTYGVGGISLALGILLFSKSTLFPAAMSLCGGLFILGTSIQQGLMEPGESSAVVSGTLGLWVTLASLLALVRAGQVRTKGVDDETDPEAVGAIGAGPMLRTCPCCGAASIR